VPGAESLPVSRMLSRVGLTIKITSDSSLSVLRVASCHGGGQGLGNRVVEEESGARSRGAETLRPSCKSVLHQNLSHLHSPQPDRQDSILSTC
jgi:hypothetical protein